MSLPTSCWLLLQNEQKRTFPPSRVPRLSSVIVPPPSAELGVLQRYLYRSRGPSGKTPRRPGPGPRTGARLPRRTKVVPSPRGRRPKSLPRQRIPAGAPSRAGRLPLLALGRQVAGAQHAVDQTVLQRLVGVHEAVPVGVR